jgi:hypothetical protein
MPISAPLRLDRLQKGVFLAIADAMAPASVGWSYGQAAFEQLGPELINLQMANGPSYWTQRGKRGSTILPFDSLTLDVTASTPGKRDIVSLNGIEFFVDVVAQTPEQIRDELIVSLNADANDPWSAAPGVAVSELVITPASFGAIWSAEVSGEIEALSQVVSGNAATLTQGTRVFNITIECFSKEREPRNGAWALMSRIESIFETADYVDTLSEYGVALWNKGIATDISAIAGANWESRVTIDVQMAMRSALVRPVDHIETVLGTINALGSGGSIISTTSFVATPP